MLNSYFEKIYLINLDRRPDRLSQVMDELNRVGISEIQRIPAIDGKTLPAHPHINAGNMGCIQTHLSIVKEARQLGLKNYLVLEDDVVFHPDFRQLFELYYPEVPKSYDLLYLGANHNSGVNYYQPHVCRCIASYTTHAFSASASIYNAMIRLWENADAEIDVCLARLHKYYEAVCFIPNLAWQRNGYSDIAEKDCDYDFLHNNRQTTAYKN